MKLVSALTYKGSVPENAAVVEIVVPLDDTRIPGLGLVPVSFEIIAVLLRQKGVIAHITAGKTSGHGH